MHFCAHKSLPLRYSDASFPTILGQIGWTMKAKPSTARVIELISNIVIIVVPVIVGVVIVKARYFSTPPHAIVRPSVGTSIDIPGEHFLDHEETLIFALQNGCHYCEESAPFYRRLISEINHRDGIHLMVLLPQDNSPEYIHRLNLRINDVKLVSFSKYRIGATPMLMTVDPQGKLSHLWIGKLSPAVESDVLQTVSAACAACSIGAEK